MILLLIKRIGALLFSLLVIVIVGFKLSESVPGDPVMQMMGIANPSYAGKSELIARQYDKLYYQSGFHLPDFYFTWTNPSVPDSFFRVPQEERRAQLIKLSSISGKQSLVYAFRKSEEKLSEFISLNNSIDPAEKIKQRNYISILKKQLTIEEVEKLISNNELESADDSLTVMEYRRMNKLFDSFKKESAGIEKWLPIIAFHKNNRFQQWLLGDDLQTGVLQGNLGYSTVTHRPVKAMLGKAFGITFILSLAAIFISVFFSIPIAILLVLYRNKKLVKLAPGILLFIYSIPLFFMSTILLMLFANPALLNWFPSSGIAPAEGFNPAFSFVQKTALGAWYLILPLTAYTLGSLAYFIRLMQSSLTDQLDADYITTARAKGASEKRIIGYHALRNSLIPLITTASTALPAMISGSIILENIFSIPGMGTEIVRAVQNLDYPVMIGFFLLMGFVTIVIYMLSDLFHALSDPRIINRAKEQQHV